MMLARIVSHLLLVSYALAAVLSRSGEVASLDVVIPSNRNDDQYYNVNLDFNGQILPVLIDTGSGDLFVASSECNNTDSNSGCYLSKEYYLTNSTTILPDELFGSVVGEGEVEGNQSIIAVGFGGITLKDFGTPLIFYADANEFQQGSFSGLFGVSPRNVSRNFYFNNRLPPVDEMISSGLLSKPLFSLSFPRLGDKESTTGKLTLGDIEPRIGKCEITYNEIIDTPNYNYDGFPLSPQSWTLQLQAIRVNGVQVNISSEDSGGLLGIGKYLSLIDSGSQMILFRRDEFNSIAALFRGKTIFYPGQAVYFECSEPQVVEIMYHDRWFPVDPLDLIIPSDHGVVNGTVMCHAALGIWDRAFADSILGVPFLRSTYTVYDYQTFDLYSKQPRLGMASNVDIGAALARYPTTYQKRLL